MSRNDGGPAFPNSTEHDQHGQVLNYANPGMTLRDYFAASPLQGVLANGLIKVAECAEKRGISCADYYAICSYEYADAMLAAREAK
jgi:hypothetical protein